MQNFCFGFDTYIFLELFQIGLTHLCLESDSYAMIHIQGSDKLTCMHWIKKASISHSKSPSGCEKARTPNVVSLQSVDIIISAPPSATATQLNPPSWPIIVCNGRVGGFGGNSSHYILWLVKIGGNWLSGRRGRTYDDIHTLEADNTRGASFFTARRAFWMGYRCFFDSMVLGGFTTLEVSPRFL